MPQKCLYGWQRKFALVPLDLFMVGWLVFAVGHIWRLIVDTNVDTNDRDPSDSFNYPYYVTLAGGRLYIYWELCTKFFQVWLALLCGLWWLSLAPSTLLRLVGSCMTAD